MQPAVHGGAEPARAQPARASLGERMLLLAVDQAVAGADEVADRLVARRRVERDEVLHGEAEHLAPGPAVDSGEELVALGDPAVAEDVVELVVLGSVDRERRDHGEAGDAVAAQRKERLVAVAPRCGRRPGPSLMGLGA